MNKLGLYIHIPFCRQKCGYCDFLSFECKSDKLLGEYAKALILDTYGNRGSPEPVSCTVYTHWCEQDHCHGAVYRFLRISYPVDYIVLLVDQCRHKLRGVYGTAAHLKEMGSRPLDHLLRKLIDIIYPTHSSDRIGTVMRSYDKRLRLII